MWHGGHCVHTILRTFARTDFESDACIMQVATFWEPIHCKSTKLVFLWVKDGMMIVEGSVCTFLRTFAPPLILNLVLFYTILWCVKNYATFSNILRSRAAESVAAQQRRCELSKGLVSRVSCTQIRRAIGSLREQERARGSQREQESSILSMPQHCFVAKQLNTTLFCRKTLKYGTLCRETLKYSTFCREMLKYALWAQKWHELRYELTPHFLLLCRCACQFVAMWPKKARLQLGRQLCFGVRAITTGGLWDGGPVRFVRNPKNLRPRSFYGFLPALLKDRPAWLWGHRAA